LFCFLHRCSGRYLHFVTYHSVLIYNLRPLCYHPRCSTVTVSLPSLLHHLPHFPILHGSTFTYRSVSTPLHSLHRLFHRWDTAITPPTALPPYTAAAVHHTLPFTISTLPIFYRCSSVTLPVTTFVYVLPYDYYRYVLVCSVPVVVSFIHQFICVVVYTARSIFWFVLTVVRCSVHSVLPYFYHLQISDRFVWSTFISVPRLPTISFYTTCSILLPRTADTFVVRFSVTTLITIYTCVVPTDFDLPFSFYRYVVTCSFLGHHSYTLLFVFAISLFSMGRFLFTPPTVTYHFCVLDYGYVFISSSPLISFLILHVLPTFVRPFRSTFCSRNFIPVRYISLQILTILPLFFWNSTVFSYSGVTWRVPLRAAISTFWFHLDDTPFCIYCFHSYHTPFRHTIYTYTFLLPIYS